MKDPACGTLNCEGLQNNVPFVNKKTLQCEKTVCFCPKDCCANWTFYI